MASQDLQWLLLRNNSSFLVKRDGAQFTREPNNLTNINSFKFSGLANNETVGLSVASVKDKKKIVLSQKRASLSNKPAQTHTTRFLTKHMRKGTCQSAGTIKTVTKKSFYRADLEKYAKARYHALHNSLKPVTATPKQQQRKRRGAAAKAKAAAPAAKSS